MYMKREKSVRFPVFRERFLQLKGDRTTIEFAKNLGIARATVGFYEAGERIPDALGIEKICRVCGVSADWLLGISDTKTLDITTKAICEATGLSEKAVEDLILLKKAEKFSGAEVGLIKAADRLISNRKFKALLYDLRDLSNPKTLKLNEKAGFDYLFNLADDITSPKVRVIDGIEYSATRILGDIMEDILKENPGKKDLFANNIVLKRKNSDSEN